MTNEEAKNRLIKSRAKLMQGHIGMASMLLNLELVEAETGLETMATDGKRIIYNPAFVLDVDEEELRSVLVHEALHVVYQHCFRRGNRHHKVWNIACDYSINGLLKYDLRMKLPNGLWSHKYRGLSSEEIYRDLIKDEDNLQEAIDTINEDKGSKESDNNSQSGNKSGEKVGDISLDNIPMPVGEVWDCQDENGNPLSDSEITELKGEIQRLSAMSEKLEKAMSEDGTSSFGNSMNELERNLVNWKDELSDVLFSLFSTDKTWAKPNRRHYHRGLYLPSNVKDSNGGEAVVSIDSSGSVTQFELDVYATEIQAMLEDCGLEIVRVCYCDTTVRKNREGEWWDTFNIAEGEEIKLIARGGGGTDFTPPFNLYNDWTQDTENVQVFIYFSDGEGYVDPKVEPDVPVIWCFTSYYEKKMPFGDVITVNPSSLYQD